MAEDTGDREARVAKRLSGAFRELTNLPITSSGSGVASKVEAGAPGGSDGQVSGGEEQQRGEAQQLVTEDELANPSATLNAWRQTFEELKQLPVAGDTSGGDLPHNCDCEQELAMKKTAWRKEKFSTVQLCAMTKLYERLVNVDPSSLHELDQALEAECKEAQERKEQLRAEHRALKAQVRKELDTLRAEASRAAQAIEDMDETYQLVQEERQKIIELLSSASPLGHGAAPGLSEQEERKLLEDEARWLTSQLELESRRLESWTVALEAEAAACTPAPPCASDSAMHAQQRSKDGEVSASQPGAEAAPGRQAKGQAGRAEAGDGDDDDEEEAQAGLPCKPHELALLLQNSREIFEKVPEAAQILASDVGGPRTATDDCLLALSHIYSLCHHVPRQQGEGAGGGVAEEDPVPGQVTWTLEKREEGLVCEFHVSAGLDGRDDVAVPVVLETGHSMAEVVGVRVIAGEQWACLLGLEDGKSMRVSGGDALPRAMAQLESRMRLAALRHTLLQRLNHSLSGVRFEFQSGSIIMAQWSGAATLYFKANQDWPQPGSQLALHEAQLGTGPSRNRSKEEEVKATEEFNQKIAAVLDAAGHSLEAAIPGIQQAIRRQLMA